MAEDSLAIPEITDEQVNDILQHGDVGSLEPKKRSQFLYRLAEKLELNPFSRPFDLIQVKKPDGSKKLIIYANKSCADQIRERDGLSIEPLYFGPLKIGDTYDETIYVFHVKITDGKRIGFNVGAVPIVGTQGEDRSNAIMRAWTKAERRATLAFSGLGIPDESEVSSIPNVVTVDDVAEGKPKLQPPKPTPTTSSLPRATNSTTPPVRITP